MLTTKQCSLNDIANNSPLVIASAIDRVLFPATVTNNNDDIAGKKVLLIGCGSKGRYGLILHYLSTNIDLYILSPSIPEELAAQKITWITSDLGSPLSVLDVVIDYMGQKNMKFDGVFTHDEVLIYTSALVSEKLGLTVSPAPAQATVHTQRKDFFRVWCSDHGINVPRFLRVRSASELPTEAFFDAWQLPLVIKTAYGCGKSGIVAAPSASEALLLARKMLDEYSQVQFATADCAESETITIEEFIDGQEVDVDMVVQSGVIKFFGITDNRPARPPVFDETGGLLPSKLSREAQASLIDETRKWIETHGQGINSVLHVELKYSPRLGPVFIEVNLRTGGAEVPWMIQHGFDVDLMQCAVRLALGAHIPVHDSKPLRCCSSTNDYSEREGVVTERRIPAEVLANPHFGAGRFSYQLADQVTNDGRGRAGMFLWMHTVADTQDAAEASLEEFRNAIVFRTQ